MTTQIQTLESVLLELREASLASKSDQEIKATMKKYSLPFLGEKFNRITSMNLVSTLTDYFSHEISHEELLKVLPKICDDLNMDLEELALAKKPNELAGFFITLY